MKQFFKMMFASALGTLVAIGLAVLFLSISFIGLLASMSSNNTEFVPKKNTVFKIVLSGTIQEATDENPFAQLFGEVTPQSLKDILQSIRMAKENDNVRGIYLEAGQLYAGVPSIDIIRRALIDFKTSGKFVVAYGDNYSQSAYYLSSVADKIFLNPQGVVDIHGLVSEVAFYRGILKKIGIEMLVFKVGTYKGAVEPYLLDKLSPENREQITSYQQNIWSHITSAIAESRQISPADVNDFADKGYFFTQAEKTIEAKLVDELKYQPEAEDYVKTLAGQTGKKLKTATVDKLKNTKTSTHFGAPQITVLYAEGTIVSKSLTTSLSGEHIVSEDVRDALIKLRQDDQVKAVVFRVNSRGGSAFVSEQIWKEVTELKKVKPIVVSMGDYAASGGYYISCAASKIIAEPNTLTGSIGIFGLYPNATGLYGKLDLTTDVVKTNTFGDIGDISRPMREDEKALVQSYIEKGYDTFLTRCADGRGKTKEEIDRIAQGRVWTGEQAIEHGLVDALGGLDEAIQAAAELAEITDYQVEHQTGTKDFFQQFFDKQLDDLKVSVVKSVVGDTEYNYLKAVNEMRRHTGILARMPFEYEMEPF